MQYYLRDKRRRQITDNEKVNIKDIKSLMETIIEAPFFPPNPVDTRTR